MKRDFRHGFDVSADYCGTKQGEIQAGRASFSRGQRSVRPR